MKLQKARLVTVIISGALVLWGCDTLQQALLVQKPSASLKGISFQNVSLSSAELLFDVEIENPYTVDLPLVDLDYNLVSAEKPFLDGAAKLETVIPKKGSQTVQLPVKISYLELVDAIKQFKPGAEIPYHAQVGLSFDTPAGAMRLPLNKEGTLAIPDVSDLSKINWRKLISE